MRDISDVEVVLVDNRFASLEAMGEEEFCPPPLVSGGNSAAKSSAGKKAAGNGSQLNRGASTSKGPVIPGPEVINFNSTPPPNCFPPPVLGDCNFTGAVGASSYVNVQSSGGDKSGSFAPETHSGLHSDSLTNPNDPVLSSSDDETDQADGKAHQDGAMSDPSFNSSSNCSGSGRAPPDTGQSSHSPKIVIALPRSGKTSNKSGSSGNKGKNKKNKQQASATAFWI
ncbi:hypothetical protein OROMI_021141 [Orobanche minor]